MYTFFRRLVALLLLFAAGAVHGELLTDPLAIGKRIYHEGIGASGAYIEAAVHSDVFMPGQNLACVHCHRHSGFGSSESRIVIPPIIGSMLFTNQQAGLHRDYKDGHLGNIERPAYTVDSLANALRHGIDSSGRTLLPMMPRYALSDSEIKALAGYLNSLSTAPSPGINDKEIHFATVITPDVDQSKRRAALAVIEAFLASKNAVTRNELRRAKHAPFQKEWLYNAYRKWQVHTWELQGPQESWGAQLASFYAQQPVFALLGGMGTDNWQPMQDFCETNQIPCLFPHLTTPPAIGQADFYGLYFSQGLRLEAQTVAVALRTEAKQSIVQVRRRNSARDAALELSRALDDSVVHTLDDVEVAERENLDRGFWDELLRQKRPDTLVLWLDDRDYTALDNLALALASTAQTPPAIYLSSTLFADSQRLAAHPLAGQIRLLHPYLLPNEEHKNLRYKLWAKQAGVVLVEPRVQADTYFALTLAGEALAHIRGNQTRDYFIERIEHMTDSMLNTALYPRLSLAPGQRYAAKGAYVWPLALPPQQARWIVP